MKQLMVLNWRFIFWVGIALLFPIDLEAVSIPASHHLYANFTKVSDKINCLLLNYLIEDEHEKFNEKDGFSCDDCQYNVGPNVSNDFFWKLKEFSENRGYIPIANRIEVFKIQLRGSRYDSNLQSDDYAYRLWQLLKVCWKEYEKTAKYIKEAQKRNPSEIKQAFFDSMLPVFEKGIEPLQKAYPNSELPSEYNCFKSGTYWKVKHNESEAKAQYDETENIMELIGDSILFAESKMHTFEARENAYKSAILGSLEVDDFIKKIQRNKDIINHKIKVEDNETVKEEMKVLSQNVAKWEEELLNRKATIDIDLKILGEEFGERKIDIFLWGILGVILLTIVFMISKLGVNRIGPLVKKEWQKRKEKKQAKREAKDARKQQSIEKSDSPKEVDPKIKHESEDRARNYGIKSENRTPQRIPQDQPSQNSGEEYASKSKQIPTQKDSHTPPPPRTLSWKQPTNQPSFVSTISRYLPLNPGKEGSFLINQQSDILKPNSGFEIKLSAKDAENGQITIIESEKVHKRAVLSYDHLLKPVCDLQERKAGGNRIRVIEPGKVTKKGEKWVVHSKIKISII